MQALDLTPLEESLLPDPVRRAVGQGAPEPMRQMAARGLAPLQPAETAVALYQLARPWSPEDDLDEVAVSARKSAADLPDGVLAGGLGSALDPRVLDFFARRLRGRAKVLQIILFNKATADETFAFLASVSTEAELGAIARNEQRLLRHPPIIAALYLNPKTPMSIATRAIELAVRNEVVVDIPGFEAVRAALLHEGGRGDEDDLFRAAAEAEVAIPEPAAVDDEGERPEAEPSPEESEKAQSIGQMSTVAKIRLATVGTAFSRAVLIRDSNRNVAMAVIQSPHLGDNEVVRYAANRGLSEEIIRYIAGQRHFVRLYQVKVSLVNNPKCPLQAGMGLLPHLQPRDLRLLARSRSVPSALAKAAKGLMEKRTH